MSNPDSSSQGLLDRVQSFVTENKRAILVGTALAVAAGGVALYASASSSPKASGEKKDRKHKSVKPKPRDVESGPIIEEIPVEDQPSTPSPPDHQALGSAEVYPLPVLP
jgi:import receptor subunit TOM70